MNKSIVIGKDVDAKKGFSSARRNDKSIQRIRDERERQLGSLGGVIGNIGRDGTALSAESIATELGGMSAAERTPALLALQQTHGNQYVQRVVAGIQAKLVVGQPGDIYEQEADQVADAVMRMPEPGVQRQIEPEEEEEEEIQAKPLAEEIAQRVQRQVEPEEEEEEEIQTKQLPSQTHKIVPDVETRINSIRGGGQPLPESARAFFEPRFKHDFSRVRVHTDAKAADTARAVNARAFTRGHDVVFGAGQYAPGTHEGRRLVAHELTHVRQQQSSLNGVIINRYPRGALEEWVIAKAKKRNAKTKTARRAVSTVTIKRKNISLKGEDKYGHWWAEIDGSESYGWWPKYPVGLWETLTGTDGELNGQTSFSGTPTKDPHHGDSADESFNPTAPAGTTNSAIKTCMRKFAKSYSGEWRWTFGGGQNCRTFQEDMMKKCDLQKK